jgi:hypothetical protein
VYTDRYQKTQYRGRNDSLIGNFAIKKGNLPTVLLNSHMRCVARRELMKYFRVKPAFVPVIILSRQGFKSAGM